MNIMHFITVDELTVYGVSKQAVYQAGKERRVTIKGGKLDAVKSLARLTKNQNPAKPNKLITALQLAITDRGWGAEQPKGEQCEPALPGDSGGFYEARARLEIARAGLAELELQKARNELLDAASVSRVWGERVTNARSRMLLIPHRLAVRLARITDETEIQELLKDEIFAALQDLAGKPADYIQGV